MSLELLQSVENAEANADQIRLEAQHQARELLKKAEEACAAQARDAAKAHRALLQQELDTATQAIAADIKAQGGRLDVQRAARRATATENLPKAVEFVFERILSHGNH